jgi:predicted transposase/invertase (TIGR01784 family)
MKPENERNPLSPRNDHYFKRIFGDERNHEILSSFLKATLDTPEEEYDEIDILNPNTNTEFDGDKYSVLDVKLRTKSGQIINVEIQRHRVGAFRNRVVYQEAKLIEEQLGRGDYYDKVNRAVCIVITEFAFITENDEYHNKYMLYDKRTGSTFSDIISIETLELAKLPETDNGDPLLDWLRFLDSDEVGEMKAIAEKNKEVWKAVMRYNELNEDENERRLAEAAEDRRRMEYGIKQYAWQEGLAEGRAAGRAAGRAEEALSIARRMKTQGLSVQELAEYLDLSEEEVGKI